jgi:hypothetical protein
MTKCTRSIAVLVSTLVLLATGGLQTASAQRAAASNVEAGRSHFDRGVDYYRDGNTNAALIEFKRAYEASPNYRVLYNLGQVANALNDYVEAQRYFQRYLDEGGSEIAAERRAEVYSVVTKLAGRIALVTVECNVAGAQILVDDVAVGTAPLAKPLRLSAGTRHLSAAMSGRPRTERVIEAVGGESQTVALELAPPPEAAEPKPSVVYRETNSSAVPGATIWLGVATGALAVGTGVMGYLAAQDGSKFHDALARSTTASEVSRLHDRAATKALVTDILLGATAVTGAITLFVALQGRKPEATERSNERAQLSLGLGSVQLSGHLD